MDSMDTYVELESPKVKQEAVWKDLVSGTAGGIAQVLVGQPFDTTKVRLQSAPEGKYSGAMDVVKQLIKNEGFKGFYKGTLTPLVGVGACVSVQFSVNEGVKRYFAQVNGHSSLSYTQLYIAGLSAGTANAVLASPIEQVRVRLQTQTGGPGTQEFNGPIECIKKLQKAGSVFRGLVPTILRESHGMGMYFLAAEALVKRDMRVNNITREAVPSYRLCAYGGAAGVSMWLAVYPVDLLKSRMQTDAIDPSKRKYANLRECYRETMKTGWRSFFKGFGPTMVRAVPANAATFLAFENTRRLLG